MPGPGFDGMGEEGFEPPQQLRHSVYSRARLSHSGAPPGAFDSRGHLTSLVEGV
jgi:hypothetical protein